MTLREHLEAIRDTAKECDDIQNTAELHFLCSHIVDDAVAALAILDFKPLDSDLPEKKRPDGWLQTELERAKRDAAQIPHWMRSNEGESYPPPTT